MGVKDNRYEYKKIAPDGGYGWVVLFACFMVSFIVDGSMYSIGLILPHIRVNYDVAQDKVNLVNGLFTGFLFCSGPIVSGLSTQFGIRPVVIGGAIVTSACMVATAFAPSIYFIMIVYGVIGGVAAGCVYIASLIVIGDYFDKKMGIATGITMAGSGVGSFVFAPLFEILIGMFDWKFTLIIAACIMIHCCVLGALLKPLPLTKVLKQSQLREVSPSGKYLEDEPQQSTSQVKDIAAFTGSMYSIRTNNEEDSDKKQNVAIKILKEMFDLRLLCTNKIFLLAVLSQFVIFIGYFLPFIYIPLRARELGIEKISWILSVIGIVNIPSRLGFGFVADSGLIAAINLNTMVVGLCTAVVLAYFLFTTFVSQLVFAAIFAVGIGGMNCLCSPYLKDIVGKDDFGKAMGIINLFRGLACLFGQPLGGFLSETTKSNLTAFFFSGVCFAIGFLFTGIISFMSMIQRCRGGGNKGNRGAPTRAETSPLNA